MRRKVRINFTDFWHESTLDAIRANPLYKLLSKRFDLEISQQPDFLLYSCFGVEFIRYRCTRIFYTGENRRPDFRDCDFAFSFDYPVTDRNFRLPLYGLYGVGGLFEPKDVDALFSGKQRFCNFVYSNARAQERVIFMQKLSRYKQVDCGGKLHNNIGRLVDDKIAFMRPYKFTIAFENTSAPGYTTEKIAEALVANTVPIYWGNPLVARDFNPQAFVNCHDFANLEAVVDFVAELDKNDALYRQYLGAAAFVDNRPNEFIDEEKILDRFEVIFANPPAQPIGATWRGTLTRMLNEPRLLRRRRRANRQVREQPPLIKS